MAEKIDFLAYLAGTASKVADAGAERLAKKIAGGGSDEQSAAREQPRPLTNTQAIEPVNQPGAIVDVLAKWRTPLMVVGVLLTGVLVYRLVK